MKQYETVIGLEVHVELATRTKIFCGCRTEFGAAPNTHVCQVCAGFFPAPFFASDVFRESGGVPSGRRDAELTIVC